MDEAIRQMMMQMQARRMMESLSGGNQLPAAVQRSIMTQPSYGEGEVLPPAASRIPGYEAYGAEIGAAQGQPQRDQDMRDALAMRGYGSTIPTVEAQQNSMFGTPISDVRSDPVSQLMLQMQLQQLMGGGDNSEFMQSPLGGRPGPPGFEPAGPPQAWFENPSWLQGETPESYAGPHPGPAGLSGGYAGRGKFGDLFGPNSPLRGTYRHTVPF